MPNSRRDRSFRIYYRGGMADNGLIDAEAFGDSLVGAARLYSMLAHYSTLGYMPRKRKAFEVYSRATVQGQSVDQELVLLAVSHADLVSAAFGAIFKTLLDGAIKWWTSPKESDKTRKELEIILEQHRTIDRLANRAMDLNERLIERLPRVGEESRSHLVKLVKPLEESSCTSIVQLPNDSKQITLTPDDVDTINWDVVRTEEVFRFRFRRIRRVNADSGNCSIASVRQKTP